jgi:asparagine synthase (glutamine-hydrolysing)
MCGIAGIVDLSGRRPVPPGALQRMADAIVHRGPDDEGYFERAGLGFANRRLSIVGLADGHQPIANEDGSVVAVFNGEFFDYAQRKHALEAKGHRFATHCDTELLPHLWEEHQEDLCGRLRGQFAFAVWDDTRRRVVLARDRFGICPLYWTRQRSSEGDWLLFASEIKALLASGLVDATPDLRGIDQVFHFLAVPGPATCFAGVQLLQPGHYLTIDLAGQAARLDERVYWTIDFPDRGDEENPADEDRLVDSFERVMLTAVERRLQADVPVVSYLSGGIDSSLVAALAARVRGEPIPAFTVQITTPRLDETGAAAVVARHLGSPAIVVPVGDADVVNTYPELIDAAEAPVVDTSSAAALLLARDVHRRGFKVALTGEGADEWLAGYVWYKVHRLLGLFDGVPGVRLSESIRRLLATMLGVRSRARNHIFGIARAAGPYSAFNDFHSLITASRYLFFNEETLAGLDRHNPYLELAPDVDRMRRWDPLNQSAYWAGRIHLAGHLLSLKGDRVAMHSSVETRYPFLDEDVFAFLAALHPRWKLRGFRDKYILRLLGARYLPAEIAWRPKVMFRANLDSFFAHGSPPFIDQLLSGESLRKTGWFDVDAVRLWRRRIRDGKMDMGRRIIAELGMVAVVSTQLWYRTFIDRSLADVPAPADRARSRPAPATDPA